MKKIVVLGGGTFSRIACHLSLATPAFGTTATQIHSFICDPLGFGRLPKGVKPILKLTKMADSLSDLVTNKDVADYIDKLLDDSTVKAIVMNVALCDFTMANPINQTRLSSSDSYAVTLVGDKLKVIEAIKTRRPDIFVVGFKTTADASSLEQAEAAKALIQRSGADLVLANDILTRNNMLMGKDLIPHDGYLTNIRRASLLNSIAQQCIDWCEQ